jgi:large subunit ribosomal protein L31
MKANIHPKYVEATVTCACGNSWKTMSTRSTLRTDLCSQCHPFYTGEQRIVDSAGQVDRFMRRMSMRQQPKSKTTSQQAPVATPAEERPTLASIADQLPSEEPAAAAGVPPTPDSATSSAPIGPGLEGQLDPQTQPSQS